MFYADTQHDNMFLKIVSDLIAFIVGFASVAISSHVNTHFSFTLENIYLFITDSETLLFLLKAIVSGGIALFVNVTGQKIIHRWKEKRKKGGKDE
jgi:H+/Cl- antiporter ClcA